MRHAARLKTWGRVTIATAQLNMSRFRTDEGRGGFKEGLTPTLFYRIVMTGYTTVTTISTYYVLFVPVSMHLALKPSWQVQHVVLYIVQSLVLNDYSLISESALSLVGGRNSETVLRIVVLTKYFQVIVIPRFAALVCSIQEKSYLFHFLWEFYGRLFPLTSPCAFPVHKRLGI